MRLLPSLKHLWTHHPLGNGLHGPAAGLCPVLLLVGQQRLSSDPKPPGATWCPPSLPPSIYLPASRPPTHPSVPPAVCPSTIPPPTALLDTQQVPSMPPSLLHQPILHRPSSTQPSPAAPSFSLPCLGDVRERSEVVEAKCVLPLLQRTEHHQALGDAKANRGPRSPVLPSLRGPTLAELHIAWGQKGAGRSPRTESVPFSLGFSAL